MIDKSRLSGQINPQNEIEKFNRLAQEWRDPNGKFKHVQAFNQARLDNILSVINDHFDRDPNLDLPLDNINILDIGCGAGLLSEPLADRGANVTGIDASSMSIAIANEHAKAKNTKLKYQHCLAEEFLKDPTEISTEYDVVLNTEVIEHINDKAELIHTSCQLLRPGGLLIMATLNRTIKSYFIAIIGAEYIMRYLPIGTHQWRHFVKPSEVIAQLNSHQLTLLHTQGMSLNPLTHRWRTHKNTDVNYLIYATKLKQPKTSIPT